MKITIPFITPAMVEINLSTMGFPVFYVFKLIYAKNIAMHRPISIKKMGS
jgi:hypothetical protein